MSDEQKAHEAAQKRRRRLEQKINKLCTLDADDDDSVSNGEIQKAKHAVREQLRRLTFSAEQKAEQAARERVRRMAMTEEQRARQAARERERRANMTEEKKAREAERKRIWRLNMTKEQKEEHAANKRMWRLNLTDEQKAKNAERMRSKRMKRSRKKRSLIAVAELLETIEWNGFQKNERSVAAQLFRRKPEDEIQDPYTIREQGAAPTFNGLIEEGEMSAKRKQRIV
jgi:hypothetical protein